MENNDLNAYESKLDLSYAEYVQELLDKYGSATDDYFSERSYTRFKNGEIKSLGKKVGVSRTAEGLYCHHIDEDKQILISTPNAVRNFDIPFDYQRKDRLVYCNLIEHAILHILISIENPEPNEKLQQVGIGGYTDFIRPNLIIWLASENIPSQTWQKNCYDAIYMPVDEAIDLIAGLDAFLLLNNVVTRERLEQGLSNYTSLSR